MSHGEAGSSHSSGFAAGMKQPRSGENGKGRMCAHPEVGTGAADQQHGHLPAPCRKWEFSGAMVGKCPRRVPSSCL